MKSQNYRDAAGKTYVLSRHPGLTIQSWQVNEYDPSRQTNPNDVTDTYYINSFAKLSAFLADKTRL